MLARNRLAVLLISIACYLFIIQILLLLHTQPLEINTIDDEAVTTIQFSTPARLVWGKCANVRWSVGENEGVWVNGAQRDPIGEDRLCINEDFSRPQIYVRLIDGSDRFYELPVESLAYSSAPVTIWRIVAGLLVCAGLIISTLFWLNPPQTKQLLYMLIGLWIVFIIAIFVMRDPGISRYFASRLSEDVNRTVDQYFQFP